MAQITDYTTLKDQVVSHLMRGADSAFIADVPTLIQMAEARLKRDPRVRQQSVTALAISAETAALPTDLKTVLSLTLTGPTYFGPLTQVSMNEFEDLKQSQGDDSGVPTHFAIVGTSVYYHKTPGSAYSGRLVYERTISSLSDSNTSNWLLTSHPDIYLYSALVEAAPYLKDDNRLQMWEMLREQRLEELHSQRQDYYLTAQAQPATGVVFGG